MDWGWSDERKCTVKRTLKIRYKKKAFSRMEKAMECLRFIPYIKSHYNPPRQKRVVVKVEN